MFLQSARCGLAKVLIIVVCEFVIVLRFGLGANEGLAIGGAPIMQSPVLVG